MLGENKTAKVRTARRGQLVCNIVDGFGNTGPSYRIPSSSLYIGPQEIADVSYRYSSVYKTKQTSTYVQKCHYI